LSTQNANPQPTADSAINSGADIMLLDAESADPTFTSDGCAATTFYNGVDMATPDFSGAGTFTVDSAVPSTFFSGPLAAAQFSSLPLPPVQRIPERLNLKLVLFGVTPVVLWGAHLQWTYSGGRLATGQINGAITNHDVQYVLVPSLAAQYDQQIQNDPNSILSKQLEGLFDVGDSNGGNCTNLPGIVNTNGTTFGAPNDGYIAVCEVADNAIIRNVLAPDVQLFQNGVYSPSAANAAKDSFSVGMAFTAVPASF
jgi:hypothetical protein